MDTQHPRRRWIEAALVVGLFVGVILILFHDVLIGNNVLVKSNPYLYQPWRSYASQEDVERKRGDLDSFATYLPRRVELSRAVRDGRIPLWNPYIFGGTVALADPQAEALYPVALALAPANPAKAMGYDVAIHVLVAMVGMYLFLRAIGATPPGRLIGAFAYALGSFMVAEIAHPTLVATASWIPLTFWGFEVAQSRERAGTLLLTLVFVMAYLAGFPQVLLLGVVALACYAVYLSAEALSRGDRRAPLRNLRVLGISGALSVLVVSVHLLAFWEFVKNSVGLGITFEQMLTYVSHPLGLVRALIPEIYGSPAGGTFWGSIMNGAGYNVMGSTAMYSGGVAFLAAVGSLVFLRRSKHVRALWCVLLLSIGLGASPLILRAAYRLVPFIGYAAISRVCVMGCFAISALGGLGFSHFSAAGDRRSRVMFVVVVAVLVAATAALYLVLRLEGRQMTEWFMRAAGKTSLEREHPARLSEVAAWVRGGGAGWLAYEKAAVARGLAVAGGCLALAVAFASAGARRRLRASLAAAFVMLLVVDLAGFFRGSYVSQPAGAFKSVPGIEALRGMLGEVGRWRTTAADPKHDPLPANTNEIFDITSLMGRCTIVPRAVADRHAGEGAIRTGRHVSARSRPLTAVKDLMAVRLVLTDSLDTQFLTPQIHAAVGRNEELARHMGMFEAGGERRFAFMPAVGESLTFGMTIPASRYLDFGLARSADSSAGSVPLRCTLVCEGQGGRAVFDRILDPGAAGGGWEAFRVDLAAVSAGEGRLTMHFMPAVPGQARASKVAWSAVEFVVDDCRLRETSTGYEIETASAGDVLSLELASAAREIPLEVRVGDSQRSRRWILFPPHMKQRRVTIGVSGDVRQGVLVTSDSAFALLNAKVTAVPFPHKLDYDMVYDGDMSIYENRAVLEKAVCLAKQGVKSGIEGGTRVVTLPDVETARSLQCGTCDILSYEPEKVVLSVACASECFLVFADTYYPGWSARVDDRPGEVLETSIGTRAVELAAGEHRVVMTFVPKSLRSGLALTCLGVALVVAYWRARRRATAGPPSA